MSQEEDATLHEEKCPHCDRVFRGKDKYGVRSNLKRHINAIHPEEAGSGNGGRKYVCNLCSRSFTTSGNLKRHLKTFHQSPSLKPTEALFACQFCDKKFVWANSLNDHMRTAHAAEHRAVKLKPMTPLMGEDDADENQFPAVLPPAAVVAGADPNDNDAAAVLVSTTPANSKKNKDGAQQEWTCDDCGAVLSSNTKLTRHKKYHCPFREDISLPPAATAANTEVEKGQPISSRKHKGHKKARQERRRRHREELLADKDDQELERLFVEIDDLSDTPSDGVGSSTEMMGPAVDSDELETQSVGSRMSRVTSVVLKPVRAGETSLAMFMDELATSDDDGDEDVATTTNRGNAKKKSTQRAEKKTKSTNKRKRKDLEDDEKNGESDAPSSREEKDQAPNGLGATTPTIGYVPPPDHPGSLHIADDNDDASKAKNIKKKLEEKEETSRILMRRRARGELFCCPAEGCFANYAKRRSLKQHIRTAHPECAHDLWEVVEQLQ